MRRPPPPLWRRLPHVLLRREALLRAWGEAARRAIAARQGRPARQGWLLLRATTPIALRAGAAAVASWRAIRRQGWLLLLLLLRVRIGGRSLLPAGLPLRRHGRARPSHHPCRHALLLVVRRRARRLLGRRLALRLRRRRRGGRGRARVALPGLEHRIERGVDLSTGG